MVDQPAAPGDVEPHIVALGGDPVDIARGDAHQPGQVGRPELVEPRRCGGRRLTDAGQVGAASLDIGARAFDRPRQPTRLDRLHQIVDRRDIECRHRELIERSHEYYGGRMRLTRQRARDLDAVEPGHGDIEQHEVGA